MISLKESWEEKLRRNLYECLYLCYDHAFENKNLDVPVSPNIFGFIESIKKSFFVVEEIGLFT